MAHDGGREVESVVQNLGLLERGGRLVDERRERLDERVEPCGFLVEGLSCGVAL